MPRRVVTSKGKAVRLEGLAELQEKLAASLNRSNAKEIKHIHMGAALVLRDEARDLAPVIKDASKNKKAISGRLKQAIFAAYGKPESPYVLVGVNYTMAGYAWWCEFGTGTRAWKSGKNTGTMTAQPYMRPALTAVRAKCVSIIAEGYRKLLIDK